MLNKLIAYINILSKEQFVKGSKKKKVCVLFVVVVFILLWQSTFVKYANYLDKSYRLTSATGVHQEYNFIYFLYYLDYYPIAINLPTKELLFNKEGAESLLKNKSDLLLTEVGHTNRCGDHLRTFLLLPYAMFKGSPEYVSLRFFNSIVFILSLIMLYIAFWDIGRPTLGLILVALIGSYQFQIYEVFNRQNVFGWPITTAVLLLAVNLHIIIRQNISLKMILLPSIFSGAVIATVKQIRPETFPVILSVILVYVFMSKSRFRIKVMAVLLLFVSYYVTTKAWDNFFKYKIEQADQVVTSVGGTPYTGPRVNNHPLWHAVWCGLGDFDTKYGYKWNDNKAVEYVEKVLKKRYGKDSLPNADYYRTWKGEKTDFWDEGKRYYKSAALFPDYSVIIKEKILSDIKKDPIWLSAIVLKRIKRLFTEVPSVSLSIAYRSVNVPYHWVLFLLVVIILFICKEWFLFKLIIFMLPLSATCILIYSGGGNVNYNLYHIFIIGIIANWIFNSFFYHMFKKK